MKRIAAVLAGLCALAPIACPAGYGREAPDRDALWKIVSHCLADDYGAHYCDECPDPLLEYLASCADPSGQDSAAVCRETTEVWEQTPDYVALRDRKMCGCPPGFVHGLAIPLRRVTGIEDPSKPEGLWRFAWDAAVEKIGAANEGAILLAVNSPARRSQDQLHVHLVRLDGPTGQKIRAGRRVRVQDLSRVWEAAARLAEAQGIPADGYGVTVVRDPQGGGFLVATLTESPETALGSFSCLNPY